LGRPPLPQVLRDELDQLGISAASATPRSYAQALQGHESFMAQDHDFAPVHARRDAAISVARQVVAEALDQHVNITTASPDPALLFSECEVPTRPRDQFKNGASVLECTLEQRRDLAAGEAESSDEEPGDDEVAAPFRTMGQRNGLVRRECWKEVRTRCCHVHRVCFI
jgi:hypothetical protein